MAILAMVGLVAACSPASGTPVPSGSGGAPSAASSGVDLAQCQPLDLVLPSGEPLDLTGSWLGNDEGPYQVRQFGDCLWWVGQNATFTMLFFGRVQQDFMVVGPWSTVAASDHVVGGVRNDADLYIGGGVITLQIEVADGGTNADITLTKTAESESPDFGPGYSLDVTSWTRVDDTPDHPIPAGSP